MVQSRKYGRWHSPECTCSDCLAALKQHDERVKDRGDGVRCLCDDCTNTRKQLQIIADTQRREQTKGTTTVATINLCDWCETMVRSDAVGQMRFVPNTAERGGDEHEWTLCPGCVQDVMMLQQRTDFGDRPKAYKTGWVPTPVESTLPHTATELFQLALEASRQELDDK